jgi:hypothetical protein
MADQVIVKFDKDGNPVYADGKQHPTGFDKDGKPVYAAAPPPQKSLAERIINPDLSSFGVEDRVPDDQRIKSFGQAGRYLGAKTLEGAEPLAVGGAMAATAAATGGLSLPAQAIAMFLAGTGTGAASRMAQNALGHPNPSITAPGTFMDPYVGGAETMAANEVSGAIAKKLFQFGKGLLRPNLNNPFEQEIPATFSQRTGSKVAQEVEDIATPIAKGKQVNKNQEVAKTVAGREVSNLAGQKVDYTDPFQFAIRYKQSAEKALNESVAQSNAQASKATSVAKLNPETVVVGSTPSTILGPNGQPAGSTPITKTIEGPILPTNLVQGADQYLTSIDPDWRTKGVDELFKIVEDSRKPAVKTAFDIINAGTDKETGNVVPISFRQAWDFKQAAQGIGFKGDPTVPTATQGKLRSLGDAADNDIEQGIGQWKTGSQTAAQAYAQAKTIVSNRYDVFESGKIKSILGADDSSLGHLDKILEDPVELDRAKARGMDVDALRARGLQRVLLAGTDEKSGNFDASALQKAYNDPTNQAIFKKLYTPDQRSGIDNFLTALTKSSVKPSSSGVAPALVRIGYHSLFIAGSLIGAHEGGIGTGAEVVGAYIGLNQLSKQVLLRPSVANAFARMLEEPPTTPQGQMQIKMITNALRGVSIVALDSDGQQVPAKFDENGKIVPLK